MNRIITGATTGKAQVHVFEFGPNVAVLHGWGRGLDWDGFAPERGGMAGQAVLQAVGLLETGQQQGVPGAGHGHVGEAALGVRVLPLSDMIPSPIQHGHMVKLQTFGPVGGHQQQALLPLAHVPAPLRQPFDAVGHRGFPATGLQLVIRDGLLEQGIPGT